MSPAPRPINSTLSITGGSCATQFAPCPAISRLGLFIWLSGQYLGTGFAGNPHTSTLGGSIDIAMEVARRVAVSASIPGALTRMKGQYGDEVWGVSGPLEVRGRVRLGPASPAFYSIQARPLWSSAVEVRTQFLIPGFDGDPKYVGRVQRGFVQPALYGAGELNVWRFQFAPGAGILVGDREAHADLSLRMSVQLMDRLFGDVEALRRQALAVPNEPGRCQSAWMGAAGVRFQFRQGMFLTARYVGGQGDCVPQHAFMLNLGLAFGEEHIRIPTADEVGFIKKYHAKLMGMVDPVLDCQGIMRADDGTPMFRFGYPDARDPTIIWRNHVAYRVGEHFWDKGGNLYRDTDLTHPVLDVYGEAPLTFAERAAMHDCPTLPGLGSPCQVALNLPALRSKIESGSSAVQVALAEDAQIVACLAHLSPLKAAAVFTSIKEALGPILSRLPQVARWANPAASPKQEDKPPAAVASVPSQDPLAQSGGGPTAAAPAPSNPVHSGKRGTASRRLGHPQQADETNPPTPELPQLPSLPEWHGHGGKPLRSTAENTPPATKPAPSSKPQLSTAAKVVPLPSTQRPGQPPPISTVAQNPQTPSTTAKLPQGQPRPKDPAPASHGSTKPSAPVSAAADDRYSLAPEPKVPVCGTACRLALGAMAAGTVAVGGEVAKDLALIGAAAVGGSLAADVAGATGAAVAGTIVADTVAEHATAPEGATAEPRNPGSERASTSNELTPAESQIANEARTIMQSSEMAQIRSAHSSGQSIVVQVNGRLIQYEPGLPASGMTMFGENGFLIGNEAFQTQAELTKTVLHELYRLSTSTVQATGATAGAAASETEAAFQFAEKAYRIISRGAR